MRLHDKKNAYFRVLGLAICAGLFATQPCQAAPAPAAVQAWLTTADQAQLLAEQKGRPLRFKAEQVALPLHIEVDASQRYQTMAGFGASLTDATAWLIQHRLNETQRQALLKELFGRGPTGVGFDFTRLTIGASDFSRQHYSYDDQPAGKTDPSLKDFSIAPMRAEVLPVLKQALAINPQLQVMASPWSAPGWMKSNDSLIQGRLKPEMYGVFADYMLHYVEAMRAEGVPIFALTLQNEPHFEPLDYPGMRLDPAARAALIADHLGPLLRAKAPGTAILEWDHNWQEPEAPLAVLKDDRARPFIQGVAWHCYEGEVGAQAQVQAAYPDKDVWLTECSGGKWKPHWPETLPWMMHNLIIGGTRNGARGVLMWNLALDENDGPHLGGCTDCRGVVTINSKTGAITRNMEYYAFAHASRFVRQGAQRIASNSDLDGLDSVAFQNPDQSIVLIVSNAAKAERRFSVGFGGQRFAYALPVSAVVTLRWAAPATLLAKAIKGKP